MIKTGANLVEDTYIFKGGEDNPFLAPRGAFIVNGKLFVSDTGQNRVFIWNEIPKSEYATPDVILGQQELVDTGRNSGGDADATTLMYPSGLWSDGNKLVVADAWNHRVLIWNSLPSKNGQPADIVLGQPDFKGNLPNFKGIGKPPSARTLNWPYGVFSDGQSLWIADTGNRRVLYFKEFPNQNFAPADDVIGKSSFEERDYENNQAIWPYSVKISPRGEMAITDTQYYRVLIWNNWRDGLSKEADIIIGQEDFDANGQNQYKLFPDANTLNWCYDTCFYKKGLWVADTGNSRILWYPAIPSNNNERAQDLIGQKDFKRGSENADSIQSTEDSYYWPFFICIEGDTMVVADTGNHRIVFNKLRI